MPDKCNSRIRPVNPSRPDAEGYADSRLGTSLHFRLWCGRLSL
jgi:hypothetical protein